MTSALWRLYNGGDGWQILPKSARGQCVSVCHLISSVAYLILYGVISVLPFTSQLLECQISSPTTAKSWLKCTRPLSEILMQIPSSATKLHEEALHLLNTSISTALSWLCIIFEIAGCYNDRDADFSSTVGQILPLVMATKTRSNFSEVPGITVINIDEQK